MSFSSIPTVVIAKIVSKEWQYFARRQRRIVYIPVNSRAIFAMIAILMVAITPGACTSFAAVEQLRGATIVFDCATPHAGMVGVAVLGQLPVILTV